MLSVVAFCSWTQAQVVVAGISPVSIQGNYDFGVQTHPGWPSYTAGSSATGENWALALDFNIAGTFVQDTLALAMDGTPGVNPQGIDSTYEACSPLINNDVNGKIALLYRNSCDFATKAKNAQDQGAVAVIVVNREDATNLNMSANATGDGPNVTIPVVLVEKNVGDNLRTLVQSGQDVVMFIGNKIDAFPDDVGIDAQFALISPFGGAHTNLDNGFDVGVQFVNWGSNDQTGVNVTANIDDPSGTSVYNETITNLTMNSNDTIGVFPGFTNSFPAFSLATYPTGEYTLTYTVDMGATTDIAPGDNTYTSKFTVNDAILSRANLDGSGMPIATGFPSNTDGEYQSCMFIQDPNASVFGVEGIYFSPFSDTVQAPLEGEEVLISVYEWNDVWTDLDDAGFGFNDLNTAHFVSYTVGSNAEAGTVVYQAFDNAFALVDDQRYLFCLQTFNPAVSFGYDGGTNYDGIINVTRMPVGPILTNDQTNGNQWFAGGWASQNAPAIGLKIIDPSTISVDENGIVDGVVYPNPTNGNITIKLESNENANIYVTDLAGKTVHNEKASFETGAVQVDLNSLETGSYIVTVKLENGSTAQFNVVKK